MKAVVAAGGAAERDVTGHIAMTSVLIGIGIGIGWLAGDSSPGAGVFCVAR
ncbi:hypothetical protein [Xanthomonas maliensis]|uniref:hypothetical protein n=1 Tax=Xanthomonas maliensis TaxID=1321368 RepID=UPI0003A65E7B|nr:hypothetical protein [Xanthomonas maliensis]